MFHGDLVVALGLKMFVFLRITTCLFQLLSKYSPAEGKWFRELSSVNNTSTFRNPSNCPFHWSKVLNGNLFCKFGGPLRGGWLPLLGAAVAMDMLELVCVEYNNQIHTRVAMQELSSIFHHME